jgi:hypothetical protein
MSRKKLTLEITCSNPACGKAAVLTGVARTNVLQGGSAGYCSKLCGVAGKSARNPGGRKYVEYPPYCGICREPVTLTTASARFRARERGYAYCSKECRAKSDRISVSQIARAADPAERERRSVYQTAKMADPAARALIAETHRRNGHRPPPGPRVGSGGVPAPCEALLLAALPSVWKLHHRIAYGTGVGAAYFVDVALPAARVAIEVDGPSHRKTAQKARDRAKEESLLSRGFRVIRIPNENVEHVLDAVVSFIIAVAGRPATEQVARPW